MQAILVAVGSPPLPHSHQVRNSDCLVFPKGHRDEWVFYFEKERGEVYVCELARHSDKSYERAIERGVKRDSYTGWEKYL